MKSLTNTNTPFWKKVFASCGVLVLSFILLSFLSGSPFLSSPAFAEEAVDASASDLESNPVSATRIEISPVEKKLELDPGAHFVGEMLVSNTGTKDIKFNMEITPLQVHSATDSKKATKNSPAYSVNYDVASVYSQITNWITTDIESGVLKPGESTLVTYTIDVPQDVPGGGQYAMIYASAQDATGTETSVNVTASAGLSILAKVSGITREEGGISDISIPTFLLTPPISAKFHITNTGNVDEPIKAIIKVENYFTGNEISNNASNPLDKVVFPDTDRDFELTTTGSPRLGLYKVTLTTDYLNETKVTTSVVIICPLWLIVVLLLMLGIIVFSLVMRITSRSRARSNSRQASGSSGNMNI